MSTHCGNPIRQRCHFYFQSPGIFSRTQEGNNSLSYLPDICHSASLPCFLNIQVSFSCYFSAAWGHPLALLWSRSKWILIVALHLRMSFISRDIILNVEFSNSFLSAWQVLDSNPNHLHWQADSLPLSHQEKPELVPRFILCVAKIAFYWCIFTFTYSSVISMLPFSCFNEVIIIIIFLFEISHLVLLSILYYAILYPLLTLSNFLFISWMFTLTWWRKFIIAA